MAGQVVIMLGPTGSGKSIQAKHLEQVGWAWLSSGELLRRDPKANKAMGSGHLVASKQVEQLIDTALQRIEANTNIVLDGFPREMGEAKWLETKLSTLGRPLTHVFVVDISPAEAARRLVGRGRTDDGPPAQAAKWQDYRCLTIPVVEHYRQEGLLIEVDGSKSIESVAEQIGRFVSL